VTAAFSARRFFSTPKGLLIIILTCLAVLAAKGSGFRLVAPGIASAVLTAALIDGPILFMKNGKWEIPDGAILSGLFIAMILSPREPWYVAACASAVAIVTKHIFRTRFANIFNPAALALVVIFYVFGAAQNWWGALGELPPVALIALFAGGVFIADRVNKMPLVLVFLGVYFLLFTVMAFVSDPAHVSEIFRAPDLHAALYFAFFILTDPPTSPVKYSHQVTYAILVGIASFAIFESLGAVHYLLSGVLVGNVWEGWRRWNAARV
jgi:Na+-translocating ferredoxin:NAD+ oxidoreductase RnfD subunit